MFEKEDGNKEREESCDNLKQTRVCETSERLKEWWSSLAVMGGDSCSKGCTEYCIPYTEWTFFHIPICCNMCLKRMTNKIYENAETMVLRKRTKIWENNAKRWNI